MFTVDTSLLRRRVRAMTLATPNARTVAMGEVAKAMVQALVWNSRRDTNRYVRGWILAGRGAGVTGFGLPTLKDSSRRDEFIGVLENQVLRVQSSLNRLLATRAWMYERVRPVATHHRRPRPKPGLKKLDREIARTRKLLERAQEELAKFTGNKASILIGGYRGKNSGQRRLKATVREKVYGGEGSITQVGEATVLRLHNKEPHAQILEWKYGTLRKAEIAAKAIGARRAGRAYMAKLREAAGLLPAGV